MGEARRAEGRRKPIGQWVWIDDADHEVPLGHTCDECNLDNLQGVVLVGDEVFTHLEWSRLKHGTASKYNNHGCRCTDCREAIRLARVSRKSAEGSEQR